MTVEYIEMWKQLWNLADDLIQSDYIYLIDTFEQSRVKDLAQGPSMCSLAVLGFELPKLLLGMLESILSRRSTY